MQAGADLGDTGTGMLLAIGILGALFQRHTTGKGRRVQIAMQDAQLQYTRGAFVQHARTGEPAMRNGARPLAGGMAPSGHLSVQAPAAPTTTSIYSRATPIPSIGDGSWR